MCGGSQTLCLHRRGFVSNECAMTALGKQISDAQKTRSPTQPHRVLQPTRPPCTHKRTHMDSDGCPVLKRRLCRSWRACLQTFRDRNVSSTVTHYNTFQREKFILLKQEHKIEGLAARLKIFLVMQTDRQTHTQTDRERKRRERTKNNPRLSRRFPLQTSVACSRSFTCQSSSCRAKTHCSPSSNKIWYGATLPSGQPGSV